MKDVVNWIIANQLGRRNLTDEQKSFLRGKRYLAEKKQGERTDITSGQNDQKSDAADRLGHDYRVAPKTIRRDAAFARAVDKIEQTIGTEAKATIA